jgi:ferredoxin/flavodoxin---NADP+ reductase
MTQLRVAVVGSGPAGAYAVQELCDGPRALNVVVDVYEQLPVPYGLVRYGVAPDHPRIKSIVTSLGAVFDAEQVRFVGNVCVGVDVTLDDLRHHYDAVVFASGLGADRQLGIPGESLPGVCSAREFVGWYSGHPDSKVDSFALSAANAVIVGVGNVALDVARMLCRMLCRTPDELRRTDVPQHVVDVLAQSAIRDICVIGRRGAADARFSNKELGELRGLTDTEIVVDPSELPPLDTRFQEPLAGRIVATLRGYVDEPVHGGRRRLRLAFGRTPLEVLGEHEATALRTCRVAPGGTETEDILPAQFVVRSAGYRGLPFAGLPFDEASGTIPNQDGRVLGLTDQGGAVYVAGWIKRGPNGVIGANKRCAVETVAALLTDQNAPDVSCGRAERQTTTSSKRSARRTPRW